MEKSSGVKSVRHEIAIVAGPREWGDTRESWLARVPRRIPSVSFRTVRALWYGEIQDANHWAAREIKREAERISTRKEASELANKYEKIIAALDQADSEFHLPDVAALKQLVRQLRTLD